MEGDRQCEWLGGRRGASNIDIWKLQLDGTGKHFEYLTILMIKKVIKLLTQWFLQMESMPVSSLRIPLIRQGWDMGF